MHSTNDNDPAPLFTEGSSQGYHSTVANTERTISGSPVDLAANAASFFIEEPPVDLFEAFADLPALPEDVDITATTTVDTTTTTSIVQAPQGKTSAQTQQENMQE